METYHHHEIPYKLQLLFFLANVWPWKAAEGDGGKGWACSEMGLCDINPR